LHESILAEETRGKRQIWIWKKSTTRLRPPMSGKRTEGIHNTRAAEFSNVPHPVSLVGPANDRWGLARTPHTKY